MLAMLRCRRLPTSNWTRGGSRAFSLCVQQSHSTSHVSAPTSAPLKATRVQGLVPSSPALHMDMSSLQQLSFNLPFGVNMPSVAFDFDASNNSNEGGSEGVGGTEGGSPVDVVNGDAGADPAAVDPNDADESESDVEELIDDEQLASQMTPKDIVKELDRFIVGQGDAKKAVALALRNRWRRKKLPQNIKEEIMPKNILMIGPTGVGKTEIARRLAKLAHAPFIKVEATKFTEVGFHGKDVDSIIKDLTEVALNMVKTRKRQRMKKIIERNVENRILEALLTKTHSKRERSSFRTHLRNGLLDEQTINVEVPLRESDMRKMYPKEAAQAFVLNKDLLQKPEKRKLKISECRPLLEDQETEKLVNSDDVAKEAVEAVQQDGIVFLDEIDKICASGDRIHSADASSEGVQRDLLPLIEGSTINTKYGNVDTDYILFVASGAFHSCKPSDLLAELQGRLPIRVQLAPLTEADLYKILTEPETNLIKQQVALMSTEDVEIKYHESAAREIAKVAHEVNTTVENIGARRLHTVIEKVMEEISFAAEDNKDKVVEIDAEYVRSKVDGLLTKHDLSRFVL